MVTGLGLVSPLGLNQLESWQALIEGKSGIALTTRFDTSAFEVKIAGEVKGFNPNPEIISKKDLKKMDLFIQYALTATEEAMTQAGLKKMEDEEAAERFGVIIGVGMGGLPNIESEHETYMSRGPSRISPFYIPSVISNLAAGQVSIRYNAKGLNYCITSACASGAHAIGEAYRSIASGLSDVMIAGGTESTVCPTGIGGFQAMKALSTRNEDPSAASRPFDVDRDGFVLAEGAGILILESYEHAVKRGARVLAEVRGYGASGDAYHMTSPAPMGSGGRRAMALALKDAQLNPEDIDYINAHGTSTPQGDELESLAIEALFKEHATSKKLYVSSTKSSMGHALGAAGSIESVFCVLTLKNQVAPGTLNLNKASENCRLEYLAGGAREGQFRYVLNNSFGFGGTNCSLIFGSV